MTNNCATPDRYLNWGLTFDDGPGPIYTQQIIDILRAWNAPATFFVVGVHAQRYPSLVREEAADGFAIGDHTMYHLDLTKLNVSQVKDAISSAASTIRSVTGNNCLWLFRPPYGHYDPAVISTAKSQGLITQLWDLDGLDWTRPGPTFIANRIIGGLHSGAIILMHDSAPDFEHQDRSQTVAALPNILAALRVRGLRPVTLPQLLSDAGYVTLNP
jgi:peptidoglycan/xylan/chitin deacetylase (PgdA/CDA1 family)